MSDQQHVPAATPAGSPDGKRKRRMTARWRYTNRLNARASTGPKTAGGKARVACNALRHGLSVPLLSDLGFAPEVVELARTIAQSVAGANLDGERHELACRVAEALIDLRRVRLVKRPLVAEVAADLRHCAKPLGELLRLDRYEQRALARRKRAVHAFYEGLIGLRIAKALRPKRQNKAMRGKVNDFNESGREARCSGHLQQNQDRSAEQSHSGKAQ